jgi:hypothetical protein
MLNLREEFKNYLKFAGNGKWNLKELQRTMNKNGSYTFNNSHTTMNKNYNNCRVSMKDNWKNLKQKVN